MESPIHGVEALQWRWLIRNTHAKERSQVMFFCGICVAVTATDELEGG